MYLPKLHAETDPAVIDAFIRANGFATLVTTADGREPGVTHLPIELVRTDQGERILEGHVSRANPQWRDLEAGARALVIFSGPHSYVSPTWYDHENVPTWNYQVVHASGPAELVTDGAEQHDLLARLGAHYEPETAPPPRFHVDTMTPDYYAKEVRGIVAFRVRVDRVEAAFKLSQNRHQADHARIIHKLIERGDANSVAVAHAMAGQHRARFGAEALDAPGRQAAPPRP